MYVIQYPFLLIKFDFRNQNLMEIVEIHSVHISHEEKKTEDRR